MLTENEINSSAELAVYNFERAKYLVTEKTRLLLEKWQ